MKFITDSAGRAGISFRDELGREGPTDLKAK
jgi:hypothetical protein